MIHRFSLLLCCPLVSLVDYISFKCERKDTKGKGCTTDVVERERVGRRIKGIQQFGLDKDKESQRERLLDWIRGTTSDLIVLPLPSLWANRHKLVHEATNERRKKEKKIIRWARSGMCNKHRGAYTKMGMDRGEGDR